MDAVYNLLRTVVRGFYDIKAVIILDALLLHHVLTDRELTTATGVPAKIVRSTCARLKQDHIIKEAQRKESGNSGGRAYAQTLYYIHFTEAVDAIKWKIHAVETKLKEELDRQSNAQEFVCENCGSTFDTLGVVAHFDPESQQFLCPTCNSPLNEVDTKTTQTNPNDNEMEELMVQLRPLIIELKKIDEVTIPENTFESELMQQVPLYDEDLGAGYSDMFASTNQPSNLGEQDSSNGLTIAGSANSRLPQQVQSTFQVNITSEAEQRELQETSQLEKQRLAKENALPDWHTRSTVSTDISSNKNQSRDTKETTGESTSRDDIKPETNVENAMDEYYKKLQSQQQEEEEEEEDEFEDLV